jgi:hypothetical protein
MRRCARPGRPPCRGGRAVAGRRPGGPRSRPGCRGERGATCPLRPALQGNAARTPEACDAEGSMTATSTASRKAGVCSASQVFTQAPVRPGARPSNTPGPVVSALTNEVGHGSLRRYPAGSSTQRTDRARVTSMPSTAAGSGGGSQPTATATSARCTVGQDTPVLAGDLVDGTVGSGHGTGEVLPPPCGQPRPRRDRGGGPGERPSPARALQAAQAAHAPPQLHPPPRGGQIPGSLPAAVLHPRTRNAGTSPSSGSSQSRPGALDVDALDICDP